ncbi:hypothetical protein BIW11_11294 [Tropilaelaps mercedesae]|uniref:Uncharacterized protein n=1 Tax=Tropilaelaps mercedesae TaxID=418985 RepID=A0A1V9XBQ0_9ACAR|nr:hypothetical protein BIW11_11294 [Tropilaelaps mercedesae]
MSLLLRRILGGFSWIDDILQLISAGPEGIFKGTSWWFAQLFVRVPYILPFFFYWNAVKGRIDTPAVPLCDHTAFHLTFI